MNAAAPILEMKEIIKRFPGVVALGGVTFDVRRGEVHALMGENGAGKSTLMKVLSGVHPAGSYEGEIVVEGRARRFAGIRQSESAGIAIIHQELSLVPQLTIAENIALGVEPARFGVIDEERTARQAETALARIGLQRPVDTPIKLLGMGEQQMVEIAKALAKGAHILILDEPTAALSESEAARLLGLVRDLRAGGTAVVFISHRLNEVLSLADRITVLRDGRSVGTWPRAELDEARLIARMVGRDLGEIFPKRKSAIGEVAFACRGWTATEPGTGRAVKDISFTVRRGEVLGFAGLVGAGRTELMMSLFGAWGERTGGEALVAGQPLSATSPAATIAAGVSLASEDRKRYGLILSDEIRRNISLASLKRLAPRGAVDEEAETREAETHAKSMRIRAPSVEERAINLSGGNQQKVVLAKWLMTRPRVFIFDEPTRGVDVGAKMEIYGIIEKLAEDGAAVIIVSSELPELLGLCDRIAVICEGRLTGELSAAEATQEKIMRLATARENHETKRGE